MMSPAAITNTGRGPTLATGGPYSAECVEDEFSEVRVEHVQLASCRRRANLKRGGHLL